eukprot:9849954-Alexandrium_andersonii.AAC.1
MREGEEQARGCERCTRSDTHRTHAHAHKHSERANTNHAPNTPARTPETQTQRHAHETKRAHYTHGGAEHSVVQGCLGVTP